MLRNEQPDAVATVARTIREKAGLADDGDAYGFLSDYYAALCARLETGLLVGRSAKVSLPMRSEIPNLTPIHYFFARKPFSTTAAFTSALNASGSSVSPSRMSMARRVPPSRLELKSCWGSSSDAPLANVSLILSL